jgi:hypothetical protein
MKLPDGFDLVVHHFNDIISDFEFTGNFEIHKGGVFQLKVAYYATLYNMYPTKVKAKLFGLFEYTRTEYVRTQVKLKRTLWITDDNFKFIYIGTCKNDT